MTAKLAARLRARKTPPRVAEVLRARRKREAA